MKTLKHKNNNISLGEAMPDRSMKEVWEHIEKTNEELGKVKEDVAMIKAEMKWIREKCYNIDRRQWYTITGIIISILLILIQIFGKV